MERRDLCIRQEAEERKKWRLRRREEPERYVTGSRYSDR